MTTQLKRLFQNEDTMPEQLVTAREVAEILGIAESTVHQLVKEGRLGCVQVATRNRRFTRELVEDFIKSQTVRRDSLWNH